MLVSNLNSPRVPCDDRADQKQLCADWHGSEPLTQSQPKGSIDGMPGAFGEDGVCLPPAWHAPTRSVP